MDVYSLFASTMISLLVAGGAIIIVALAYKQVPGFLSCGIGFFLIGLGVGVILLRLVIPGKAIILLSNLVLVIGAKFFLDGVRVFRGRPPFKQSVSFGAAIVFIASIVYWLYIDERQAMRTGAASILFVCTSIAGGITLIRGVAGKDRVIYWMTGGALLLDAAFLLVRAWSAFEGRPVGRLFGEGPLETATLIAENLGAIMCGFGLLTASNLRFIREVEDLALQDPLTHLPNRRNFEERFLEAGRRASRANRRLALIYMDVDGFKQINDSLGHEAGDEVLRTVAQRLSAAARESDCVARLGGDEFVLLVEDAGGQYELSVIVERLKRCVSQELLIGKQALKPSISCGLAVYPDDVRSVERLVACADIAMYDAKRKGLALESNVSS